MVPAPVPLPLAAIRIAIDRVDAALLLLFAARRALVGAADGAKRTLGLAGRDAEREADVAARAARIARQFALPPASTAALVRTLIEDAWDQQGIDAGSDHVHGILDGSRDMQSTHHRRPSAIDRVLRLLPPPARLAPLARAVPFAVRARVLEQAMARVLAGPIAGGALEFMRGRRLGLEVSDLGLRWVVELRDGRLSVCAPGVESEAAVRGTLTDLLLLAARLEDADTLFFHRRLLLTGDTELGLTARNMLDQLPWESIPLGLRIALDRTARLAAHARSLATQQLAQPIRADAS